MKKLISLVLVLSMLLLVSCAKNNSGKNSDGTNEPDTGSSDGVEIPDKIKIGVITSISGVQALDGEHMMATINFVKEELAAAGGFKIGDKTVEIEFVVEDDEGKPEIAVNCAQKLIDEEGVSVILGPNTSTNAIAAGEIAQGAQIPLITPTGTDEKVTEVGDYIFRACFYNPIQAKVAAAFAYNELGARTVGIIYDNSDAHGSGLASRFTEAFTDLGGTIVATEAFAGAQVTDYSAQLTIIKNADPDLVYCPLLLNNVPLVVQQYDAMNMDAPILGCNSWDWDSLIELCGADKIEGAYYVTGFSPDAESAAEFSPAFEEYAGFVPSFVSAMCYESIHIILDSLQRATSFDGTGIRDAMWEVDIDTISGHTSFDENRNPDKPAVIMQVQNGKRVYLTTMSGE